jgi:predicted deacylase
VLLDVFQYQGTKPGPHVLLLGAVHGREVCGTRALNRLKADIDAGVVEVEAGTLTLVPVCNPKAQQLDERLIDENLNRVIAQHANPQTYEQHLANKLIPLLDACDISIDLHSTTSYGEPFCFMDFPNAPTRELVQFMQVPYIITGWPEMYVEEALEGDSTDSYLGKQGKAATCLECGQHYAPESEQTAYDSCLNALRHYGVVAGDAVKSNSKTLRMHSFWRREHGQDVIAQQWQGFQPVKQGETLLNRVSGEEVSAPCDGYVIFCPNYKKIGSEMIYFGVEDHA